MTVPESLEDARAVLQLAAANPLIAPCAGLHPVQPVHADGVPYSSARCVALEDLSPMLDFIRANADSLVAIGEVGVRGRDAADGIMQWVWVWVCV